MGDVTKDRIAARTLELVATASVTGNEQAAAELVASWLSPVADEIDHWTASMDELESDADYPGREIERGAVPVVAAKIAGRRPGPSVLLTGHLDTVAVDNAADWSRNPAGEIDGDLLYGRGAADMKAGLVAAVECFTELGRADRDFAGEVRLVAVPGEEDGGTGTLAAIRRGWTADRVIVAEPTSGPDGPQIVVAHGGALTFTIDVSGRAAHAATPSEGESALDHFWTVYGALKKLEVEMTDAETDPLMHAIGRPYPTTVGIVSGGTWASNVMERLTASIRVGVALGETISEAEARFERSLRKAIAGDRWLDAHPFRIERTGAAFGSSSIPPEDPLVVAVADAAETVTGSRPATKGVPYGCDMAMWRRVGGAAALVYGPGDVRQAHSVDEHVSISETARVAAVLIETAHNLLR